jgi:hypothetical protein
VPTVTTQFRMFVPRRRRIGGGGATVDILPAAVNLVSGDYTSIAPETIEIHYPSATDDPRAANFVFWSVRGSAQGEFTQDDPALVAHTGAGALSATAWYCLAAVPGGTNGGGTELETDAFLVDQDAFVEPTPIASVTPADAWDHTDVDEFVFTSTESSDLQALDTVIDPNEHFERWYALEGGATPTSGRGLHVPQGDNGIAIATFRVPPPVDLKPPPDDHREGGTIVGGVAHDGSGGIIINGHFHPIGPWDPMLAALSIYRAALGLRKDARLRVQREALRSISAEAQRLQSELKSESEVAALAARGNGEKLPVAPA